MIIQIVILILWFSIGAASFIYGEQNIKYWKVKTRGEYISNLLFSSLFAPLVLVITISESDWWNKRI